MSAAKTDDDGDRDGRPLSYIASQRLWGEAFRRMGHEPVLDHYGDADVLAYATHQCNGPACRTCGWHCCMHCMKRAMNRIPECAVVEVDEEAGADLEAQIQKAKDRIDALMERQADAADRREMRRRHERTEA